MGQSNGRRAQGHFECDQAWRDALQHAIECAMEGATPSKSAKPKIAILALSPRGNRIELELRFRTGETYCCAEPGCFLATYERKWWRTARESLLEATEREPQLLSITVHGIVEEGASLLWRKECNLPTQSPAYSYQHGPLRERDAKETSPPRTSATSKSAR